MRLTASQRIDVVHDFENIGSIPCARTSLLYGIAGGSGVGAVRYLGSRRPGVAANWAMAGFVVISIMQWYVLHHPQPILAPAHSQGAVYSCSSERASTDAIDTGTLPTSAYLQLEEEGRGFTRLFTRSQQHYSDQQPIITRAQSS